jgi:hypothetical protein
MAQTYNSGGPFPLRSMGRTEYFAGGRFDTNTTSTPDGVTPVRTGVAVARASQSSYTVTFAPAPAALTAAGAQVFGDKPGLSMRIISYSAGVLTMNMYDEDDTSGVEALANDVDNITVGWWAVFTSET